MKKQKKQKNNQAPESLPHDFPWLSVGMRHQGNTTAMRLTTKSRYGTRLILDIAVHGKERPVPLKDVSSRQKISVKYLEQLTRKLKKAGVISSSRGPYGGHRLAMPPEGISVGHIVRILESSAAISGCEGEVEKTCEICSLSGGCLSRWIWVEACRAMFERLDQITIASLLSPENKHFRFK